ncbi:AAA family ATPase [Caldisalinibacter kiritimatiensis]|uniref:AAA ATPase, central region n=1 Tax=Caldisalinibacter kiritimatiensis TaxID=1304284 RepID=R1CQW5_9FIRM|nr:AAA family ATPase [Caldisalinibacter kiritimatiensis]EOD01051.1 AAA ATPase, central region [Caldisalinibacter kiritimatiensis]
MANKVNEEIISLYRLGKVSLNTTFEQLYDSKAVQSIKPKDKQIETLEDVITELNKLVGLQNVKNLINEIRAFIEIQEKRKKENLRTEPIVLHMIFKGNPGTGKTTVARLLGRILKNMGILQKGHLIEIERADIVGEYIGHTAIKVKQQVNKAMGGILFIDEAYSLARGGEKDFGKEAIDALVKAMEDNKENLVLILAGYCDEMEMFLRTNPGLKSRFPIHVEFKDYNVNELIKIAKKIAEEREYTLTNKSIEKLKQIIIYQNNSENSGNARLVRNIIERAIRKQAVRLQKKSFISKSDLLLIKAEDIEGEGKY